MQARTHIMMLHSEFCAVWLSLSDDTGKRTLHINIHIEQVPATLNQQFHDYDPVAS